MFSTVLFCFCQESLIFDGKKPINTEDRYLGIKRAKHSEKNISKRPINKNQYWGNMFMFLCIGISFAINVFFCGLEHKKMVDDAFLRVYI